MTLSENPARSLSECRVLVVDDTEANIDLLVETLGEDHLISVAMDGESALEYAAESSPDLILLDIMMPGMDGYEVIRRLKENSATREIPVIFCTAMSETEDEEKGLSLGAIDYIRKPFSPPIVQARVRNHLELKLARESLKDQNALLRENIRLRDEVERIARHDIKTPLNAVISLPGILIQDGNVTESQIETLRMIEASAYRILEIVNSSLDLHKMETGTYRLHPIPVDLLKLLKQIRGETAEMLMAKDLRTEFMLGERKAAPGDRFWVAGEEMLCYSMLANLIKNAIEASPQGGTVTVTLEASNLPTAAIHNSGAVPVEIRDRFFEKYVTFGKESGTGLGTYSAALMARTMGGEIGFETSEETGSTLFVKFMAQGKARDEEPAVRPGDSVPTPAKPSRLPGGDFHVLVVDDYRNMRRILIRMLEQMGFTSFYEAENGMAALQILEKERIDLLISDWNMPKMTGIDLLSSVRGKTEWEGIPFLIISGEAQQENILEAAKRRVSDYIVKPFSAHTLKNKICRICRIDQ